MKFSFRITMCSMLIGLTSIPHNAWATMEEVMVYGTRYAITYTIVWTVMPQNFTYKDYYDNNANDGSTQDVQELRSPEEVEEKLPDNYGCNTDDGGTRLAKANAYYKASAAVSSGFMGLGLISFMTAHPAGTNYEITWPDGSVGVYSIGFSDPRSTQPLSAEISCTTSP